MDKEKKRKGERKGGEGKGRKGKERQRFLMREDINPTKFRAQNEDGTFRSQ